MNEQFLLDALNLIKATAPQVLEAARSAVEAEIAILRVIGWSVLGIGSTAAVLEAKFDSDYGKWGFFAAISAFTVILSGALFISAWYNTHTFEWQVINKIMHG